MAPCVLARKGAQEKSQNERSELASCISHPLKDGRRQSCLPDKRASRNWCSFVMLKTFVDKGFMYDENQFKVFVQMFQMSL
jgi:hypothetical protein